MNKRIRIIKRGLKEAQQDGNGAAGKGSVPQPEKASSLETVRIVTTWIGELRRKKMKDLAIAHALKHSIDENRLGFSPNRPREIRTSFLHETNAAD